MVRQKGWFGSRNKIWKALTVWGRRMDGGGAQIEHEVAAASMKYALLSCSCHVQINFDIAKVTDFEDSSAPFLLYNSTRLTSLVNKFECECICDSPPLDAHTQKRPYTPCTTLALSPH